MTRSHSNEDDPYAHETETIVTRFSQHSAYSIKKRLLNHELKRQRFESHTGRQINSDHPFGQENRVKFSRNIQVDELDENEDGDMHEVEDGATGETSTMHDHDDELKNDFERKERILFATIVNGMTVGGAVFKSSSRELLLFSDIPCESFRALEYSIQRMREQVEPSHILTNAKSRRHLPGADPETAVRLNEDDDTEIQVLSGHFFSYEAAKKLLLGLNIADFDHQVSFLSIEKQFGDANHFIEENPVFAYLNSIVPLSENPVMVCCAGALFQQLSKSRLSYELMDDGFSGAVKGRDNFGELNVRSVLHLNLHGFMHISRNTMLSLQIFCNEKHPSTYGGQSKEGLSLFGILNLTKTPAGKHLLRSWFQRPLLDKFMIEERLNAVEFFTNPGQGSLTAVISKNLRNIPQVEVILNDMMKATTLSQWKGLARFTSQSVKIREAISQVGFTSLPLFQKVEEAFDAQKLDDIGNLIVDVIDFETSAQTDRICVKPNVDDELDHQKEQYHGLGDFLCQVAEQVAKRLPPQLATTINVVYFPQLGYLTTVHLTQNAKVDPDTLLSDHGFVFQFRTDSIGYYKNPDMFELDQMIGDIHSNIVEKEIEIVQQLTDTILASEKMLRAITCILAELDCLIAFAEAAVKFKYSRPVLTEERLYEIREGRHPLQELIVENFIGNDTLLGKDNPSVMLINAANSSGKSIYLKQVGLITYMAHIGSFVPATSAIIPLTDKILTRIQTRESVALQGQFGATSAFTIDLQQITCAVLNATGRSLVLLDEFGKGTNSHDGVGLFTSILEYFAQKSVCSPFVIGATHFHEMIDILQERHQPIEFFTMDLLMSEKGDDEETTEDLVTFFYKLKPGRAASSLGLICSRIAGMNEHIVSRASVVSECVLNGRPIPIVSNEVKKRQALLSMEWIVKFENVNIVDPAELASFFNSLEAASSDLGI